MWVKLLTFPKFTPSFFIVISQRGRVEMYGISCLFQSVWLISQKRAHMASIDYSHWKLRWLGSHGTVPALRGLSGDPALPRASPAPVQVRSSRAFLLGWAELWLTERVCPGWAREAKAAWCVLLRLGFAIYVLIFSVSFSEKTLDGLIPFREYSLQITYRL